MSVIMRRVARLVAAAAIAAVCALAGVTTLGFVLARLEYPLPVRVSAEVRVAGVGYEPDGRLAVYVAPALAASWDADVLAYILFHEEGHVRYGHLWKPLPWEMEAVIARGWEHEYEADAWAAQRAAAVGIDPTRAVAAAFARYGTGGGFSHPPDAVRIERVRALAAAWRGTASLGEWRAR